MMVTHGGCPLNTCQGSDAMIAPWANEEVLTAELGDERLDARLVTLLSALGNRPNLSIPAACGGRAEMKAAYRFFDNDKVTFDKVLQPHIDRSLQRVAEQQVALLVQDTTAADRTRPEQQVAGVGTLDGSRPGVLLHEMQAFTLDGVPLGTVWAEVLNRTDGVAPASEPEKRSERLCTPIEEKESLRWLTGLRAAVAVAQQLPGVQCVCVADSEELFAEPRGEHPVHWLMRACQDRALAKDQPEQTNSGQQLRDQVLATPVLYEVELLIRGRTADPRSKSQDDSGAAWPPSKPRDAASPGGSACRHRDLATALASRPQTAGGAGERRAGPRTEPAYGRNARRVAADHHPADRHAGAGAHDRGIIRCALVYRDPVSHAEVGLSHRAPSFRAGGPRAALSGVVLDRVLAHVVRVPQGSQLSGP